MFTTRTTLATLGLAIGLTSTPAQDPAIESPVTIQPVAVVALKTGIQIHIERHGDLAYRAVARCETAALNANLDRARWAAFLNLRDLDQWHRAPWDHQGFEHAAEILMWGLAEESSPLTSVADTDTETLNNAFRSLTGIDLLNAPPLDITKGSSVLAGCAHDATRREHVEGIASIRERRQ